MPDAGQWSMREMGQHRFFPWFFAGDLVVANMQAGMGFWHRHSSPQSDAKTSRLPADSIAAPSGGGSEARKAALRSSRDVTPVERSARAPAEPAVAGPKPETPKAGAKRGGKRRPRK
jgi:hypothetical protein